MDIIRHLALFEAVASEGHFGRAAELVGMAQPPMSQAIRRLERELGCTLFERTSTGAVLTPAGRRVREAAGRLTRSLEDVRAAASGTAPAVRVLIDEALPTRWCAALARHAARAGIELDLEPSAPDDALRSARASDLPAIVLSPFRTEGLRPSAAAFAPLWEARAEPASPGGSMLAHPGVPAPALARLDRELRALGRPGPLRTGPAGAAVGLLAAGRLQSVLTTHEHLLAPSGADGIQLTRLPVEQASLGFQAVIRRRARDRGAEAAYTLMAETLMELGDD